MADPFATLIEVAPIALGAAIAIGASYLVSLVSLLKERSVSRYDVERSRAEISDMRSSFESKISELTTALTLTEGRWRDTNHLLIEAQRSQPEIIGSDGVPGSEFLRRFGLNERQIDIDERLVFVLTPFSREEEAVYIAVREVCAETGFRCVRGDEENASGAVLAHIVGLIARSRLVVANISTRNPNVFYELGIAEALGKPTILVSKSNINVPFDLASQRIIFFSSLEELKSRMLHALIGVYTSRSRS